MHQMSHTMMMIIMIGVITILCMMPSTLAVGPAVVANVAQSNPSSFMLRLPCLTIMMLFVIDGVQNMVNTILPSNILILITP